MAIVWLFNIAKIVCVNVVAIPFVDKVTDFFCLKNDFCSFFIKKINRVYLKPQVHPINYDVK